MLVTYGLVAVKALVNFLVKNIRSPDALHDALQMSCHFHHIKTNDIYSDWCCNLLAAPFLPEETPRLYLTCTHTYLYAHIHTDTLIHAHIHAHIHTQTPTHTGIPTYPHIHTHT